MRKSHLGRVLHRPTNRKKAHEQLGAPPQFHENHAPELPPLPDEFNRFAPLADEADAAAARKLHKKHLMMILLLTGAAIIGVSAFDGLSGVIPTDPAATEAPTAIVTAAAATAASAEATPAPTEAPTAEPTATPTPSPTPEPTQEPDIAGVQLMKAYWIDGEGAGANFILTVRIPKKNRDRDIMIGDFYAWLDGFGTLDDWDAIMTPSEENLFFEDAENGDQYVIYTGTLYWPNRTPPPGAAITIAATGFDRNIGEETELSNPLTVRFGELVTWEDQQESKNNP